MSFFERLMMIFNSKANKALDKAEDPRLQLHQAARNAELAALKGLSPSKQSVDELPAASSSTSESVKVAKD